MYENIPKELKVLKQWVCGVYGSKAPMNASQHAMASSIDPNTWSTFEVAESAVFNGDYDFCGFVFSNNEYVGIDIDIGYDSDGLLSQQAADIIGTCKSYTEKSISGRGFHVILRGRLPFSGKNNLAGVEMYQASRYFIMTGNVFLFKNIIENQNAIDDIVERYFPTERERRKDSSEIKIYKPIWEHPENNRIKLRPTYPQIPEGCRNICLTSLAGALHNVGYSKQQIYDELIYANKNACTPPLPINEVTTICNSVTRYKR